MRGMFGALAGLSSATTASLSLRSVLRPTFVRCFGSLSTAANRVKSRLNRSIPFEERVQPLVSAFGRDVKEGEPFMFPKEEIVELLTTKDRHLENALYAYADSVTEKYFGKKVYFRGIIEFSNRCQKNCCYCGIRRQIKKRLKRYDMTQEEMIDAALFAWESGYGTVMLQSGEIATEERLNFLVDTISKMKKETIALERKRWEQRKEEGTLPDELLKEEKTFKGIGIALSVGELPTEYYQALLDAGAHRYLLRVESSNPDLYRRLHPADHLWTDRVKCLYELKRVGFQVGTGVMIGLPFQTPQDLASDLYFFKELDADMIGMGPYIYEEGTPTGEEFLRQHPNYNKEEHYKSLFSLSTRMLALARIMLSDVNIAATTALQAINPIGREIALTRGANMMMPILTPRKFRENYQLYEGKPCIDEGAEDCRGCMISRVQFAGKELCLGEWGDPPHYFTRHALPYENHFNPQNIERNA